MSLQATYQGLLATDLPRRMLSETETEYFLKLAISEKDGGEFVANIDKNLRSRDVPLTIEIIMERIDLTKMCVSPCLVAFIGLLCDSPARAVLWSHALYMLATEKSKTKPDPLSLFDWAMWFGEHGIPDEAGCRLAWERQKHREYPNGNWLDGANAWAL